MTLFGPWVERLEAIAVAQGTFAVGGFRDAAGVANSRVHIGTVASLEGKGSGWSIDHSTAVRALAYVGEDLLLTGGDDGRLTAWDVTGRKQLGGLQFPAAVRAIAVDANVARAANGTIAIGTADGMLHVLGFSITNGAPQFAAPVGRKLSEGAVNAVAFDPAGLVLAGVAEGQLWIVAANDANAHARAVTPGGDGGIRAIVAIGDGRAAVGCGDGSLRLCFVVGDVEATDRSGDYGHEGSARALALGPVVVDAAGREQPRRIFSCGEDGTIKSWLVDGRTRPRTLEPKLGPLTALVFQGIPVNVAGAAPGVGRLWFASTERDVGAIVLSAEVEPSEPTKLGSELDRIEEQLKDGRAAAKVKLAAIGVLSTLAEDEARVLLDLATRDNVTEVQVGAIQAISTSHRRASRPALRAALNASAPFVRTAAFAALLELEREQPLAAIRVALAVSAEDIRIRAVSALIPLAPTSVIAAGMIADALRDSSINVRRAALRALRQILPALDAVRTALTRGTPDVRAEALLVLGVVVRATDAPARALASGALDDSDAGVRTAAFVAALMQQPRLAPVMYATVPTIKQLFDQVAQQLETPLNLGPAAPAKSLTDAELEPLFASLACRSADAAIRGAGCLLALGDRRAVGAVLQLTREADPALRRGATSNLVLAIATWPDDDRLTARLVWLLDDGDPEVRAFAFDALAKTAAARGPAAELDLAELALRCSQDDLRVRALQILVRAGAPGSAAELHARADALLGDALDDEAAKVRGEAFRTLWAWHTADPQTPIARGAASRHGDLRTQVVSEIARRRQAAQSTPALDKQLLALVVDPVGAVGLAAYAALTKQPDEGAQLDIAAEIHLAAMASPVTAVRAAGCIGAKRAPAAAVRARLVELIKDDHPEVHIAAIETLDVVAPNDAEGFALAFASVFWNLQVRACELCGSRRDPRAVAPSERILSVPKTDLNRPPDAIRQRAARALADVGDATAIPFMQGLVDDEDGIVREMGARGVATAARSGSETALMALLGHADLAVRSWAGEGLAKLGDLRALPVLSGTQRHDHRPLRIGAIAGFVALGPDGVRGLRQGLEDKDREIQDLAFAVIVARDAALAEAGIAPDLLVDAMASPSPEIRFAAARLFERRAAGESISGEVSAELVGPRKPDKAADMKEWPPASRRAALQQVLADAIASAEPMQRYAAAQVLAVRTQPLTYWREAARLAGPIGRGAAPRTNWSDEGRGVRRSGWLRRLVGDRREARDPDASELERLARMFARAAGGPQDPAEHAAAQRLVFGVYAGLVRQAPPRGTNAQNDDTHRVRRDAVGRLVELAREAAVGSEAVLPVLDHAIGDPHHLVRQAAMAALRSLYPVGALAPLAMAIAAAADLGKAAIDELVPLAIAGDERAAALVRGALDADDSEVRSHAALRLPRLYPAGSAEPQLIAARSKHSDVRLAAVTQLASAKQPTQAITDALVAALASEHADLRLRAAVALAKQNNPLGVDVLGAFLRSDDQANEALDALLGLASNPTSAGNAAEVVGARLDEVDGTAETTLSPDELISALSTLRHPIGAPPLVRIATAVWPGKQAEVDELATAAVRALEQIFVDRAVRPQVLPDGRERARYREALAAPHLAKLATSSNAAVRASTGTMLGNVDDRGAEVVLERLLSDRDPAVRIAAAEALALRAEYVPDATLAALEAALRGGRRELVLPAALGLAAKKRAEAFQPLLLVIKAGEPPERERAVLALGSLGDKRALEELLPLVDPQPDADDATRALTAPAIEALGRLLPTLTGDEANDTRSRLERLAIAGSGDARIRAITGLRYAGQLGIIESVAGDRETRSNVRQHAIEQVALASAPSSETVLADLLADGDFSVRNAAMTALGKVLKGDRTRVSMYALASPHDDISEPAARYLAAAGDAATLVERLGSVKSGELRQMLREGLIRRGELPRPQLEAALRDTDPRPRAEAAWIAGYAGDAAKPLADAVADAAKRGEAGWRAAQGTRNNAAKLADETHAWHAALWAATRLGAARAAEAAATAAIANDKVPVEIRREAALLLASGSAFGSLQSAIGDRDREVRAVASTAVALGAPQAAAAAVQKLGARADATTIEPLAIVAGSALAKPLLVDPNTRAWASAISLAHRERLAQMIAIAEASGEDPARLVAIAALGRIGGDDAKASLETIHGDTSQPDAVRLAAWKALKRLLRRGGKTYGENQDKGPGGPSGVGGGGSSSDDGDDDGGGDDGDGDAAASASGDGDDGDDDSGDDEDDDEDADE
ncbi:MAG: HEAT repeat domain-containing protein [Kofleriaceae bacterium]